MNKEQVYHELLRRLEARGAELQATWQSLQESNQQEGKSSAGDKHETGTAMVHLEMEQWSRQREEHDRQMQELSRSAPGLMDTTIQVVPGSLVKATNGWYYVTTGFGKIEINGITIWAISAASPVGQALLKKRLGEAFAWGKVSGQIEALL